MNPTVTIVIDNYNYAGFLGRAIDSALRQTYRPIEVIVVDDGSTDNSRDIIEAYHERVIGVFKSNGGQGSAFNAGFRVSTGDIVMFLDADDMLEPKAVETAVGAMADPHIVKVHWPMRIIDAQDVPTGEIRYSGLPSGDLQKRVRVGGPGHSPSSPTSGNAWRRHLLERIMPVPENLRYYRSCADEYLYNLAPFFGLIGSVSVPLTSYRIHGKNVYSSRTFAEKFRLEVDGYEEQAAALAATLKRNGICAELDAWRTRARYPRLQAAIEMVARQIPYGARIALIDGGSLYELDKLFPRHQVRHFFERDGMHWGEPRDSAAAVGKLAAVSAHTDYLAVLWPAFWWRESYPEFMAALRTDHVLAFHDTHCMIWRLALPRCGHVSKNKAVAHDDF